MENEQLYNFWKEKYEISKTHMRVRKSDLVLIEIAAQHPLIDGITPNEEFEKRLLLGVKLYKEMSQEHKKIYFYVPGSKHMDNGIVDKVSLSESGTKYLVSLGIPSQNIFGEDMNKKYKGNDGVYNSTDECYVSGKIFDEINASELHCVCSSGQMMRKALSYISFGYMPYMHTVSCDVMYHDYIDEIFKYIPILLEDKNALHGESEEADRLRKIRKPQNDEK